jgi:hypothetical protein
MAAETGLSATSVYRIWPTFELRPHRTETFKLSTDSLLVKKVHDAVRPLHGTSPACRHALRR